MFPDESEDSKKKKNNNATKKKGFLLILFYDRGKNRVFSHILNSANKIYPRNFLT